MPRVKSVSISDSEQLRLIPDAIGIPEIIEQLDYQIGEVQRSLDRMHETQAKLRSMVDTKGLFHAQFTDPKTFHCGLSLVLKL